MSEPVVTVFKLLGRAEHQTYDKRTNEWKADLLIQPMLEIQGGSHGSRQEVAGNHSYAGGHTDTGKENGA